MNKQRTGLSFRIDKVETRSDGAREVSGYLTKTGVYTYNRDGETVRELRSDEEVFSQASLDSLQGSLVTIDHPEDFLTVDGWKDDTVGVVSHVKAEPPYVAGKLRVWDSDAIRRIDEGYLKEVSCGYTCIPMEAQTEDADVTQTNIRFNHVSLGPEGWGRLGGDVSLRLDSNGNEVVESFPAQEVLEMEAIREALGPVLEALDSMQADISALKEKKEAEPTEDASPISKQEILPDSEQIDHLVDEKARELLAVELQARDAAEEVLGWRWNDKREEYERNPTYHVQPVLSARRIVQDVLQTEDSTVSIGDKEDLRPYLRQAELMAKTHRTARLSRLNTQDNIRKQLTGVRAHQLETPKSAIRAHIFGTNKG